MCPHHIITDFIVRPHALEVEGTCVPTPYHYSFIFHAHALEVEGTCVSTPYHYSLHWSRTGFRSRSSLYVHRTITAFIVCIPALEVE